MTPFDATALLVMLLAFYPTVSPAALSLARRERPDYFAGGTLFGSKGDKLQLPDGRAFDLIQNAGGLPGTQRWQVIEAGPGSDSPWPLEPGPLAPMDPSGVGVPRVDPSTFEALVGDALEQLGGDARALDTAHSTLAESADAGARADAGGGELADVAGAVDEVSRAQSAGEFVDVVAQSDGMLAAVASTDSDYDEPPPQPALPNEPDLPAGVPDDGSGDDPSRENPGDRPPPHDDDDDTRRRTPNA